jgi:hypothetical protein
LSPTLTRTSTPSWKYPRGPRRSRSVSHRGALLTWRRRGGPGEPASAAPAAGAGRAGAAHPGGRRAHGRSAAAPALELGGYTEWHRDAGGRSEAAVALGLERIVALPLPLTTLYQIH